MKPVKVIEIGPGKVITMKDGKTYVVDEHGALRLLVGKTVTIREGDRDVRKG